MERSAVETDQMRPNLRITISYGIAGNKYVFLESSLLVEPNVRLLNVFLCLFINVAFSLIRVKHTRKLSFSPVT